MAQYIQKSVKYFIYYRIQDDYKSFNCSNEQESCLITFAESNELSIEAIFYDTGSENDQLKQLLLAIRNNEAQGILCIHESVLTNSNSLLVKDVELSSANSSLPLFSGCITWVIVAGENGLPPSSILINDSKI